MSVAILDIDGTLVDSNYQHALAWYRAFLEHDIVLPIWRLHRHVGMGGDQLVRAVTDGTVERESGDRLRAAQKRAYHEMIAEVRPNFGAHELVRDLGRRGHSAVLASSSDRAQVEHYVDLLDVRGLADAWTSADDVEATKPQPDLVGVALERVGASPAEAVMVGDSPWDVEAAGRAGVPAVGVLTGGFSREELLEAGATGIYESMLELRLALHSAGLASLARRNGVLEGRA